MLVSIPALVRFASFLNAIVLICAAPIVVGNIQPGHFNFVNVVPVSDQNPGGWKVAQVMVTLNRMTQAGPQTFVCRIEVGVPEVNSTV